MMRIHDTVTYFVDHYKPTEEFLDQYYGKFIENYKEYFTHHCHNITEKKTNALVKHPQKIPQLIEIKEKLQKAILELKMQYEALYEITFTKDVHLLVGLYGSNAYTFRQYDPEIAFCLEKLPVNTKHLHILVGHEFGHATHHLYSAKQGIDWEKVEWNNPLTWLVQEGIATYLSTKVTDARLDEYFAFEEDPEWLLFAQENTAALKQKLLHDLNHSSNQEIFKEWFSINGGEQFGVNRLGYYIGYTLVKQLIQQHGDEQVLTLWGRNDFPEIITSQLR